MVYRRVVLACALLVLLTRPLAAQMLDTGSITAQDAGSCATPNACLTFTLPTGSNALTLQASGTFSATGTIEGTSDGTNWFTLLATKLADGATTTTITATGQYAIPNAGLLRVRVRAGTWASGTLTITATRGFLNARLMTPNFTSLTLKAASGGAVCTSPADGTILCTNAAGTDFTSFQYGGTTSSFPELKRVGTQLQFRLADDSGSAGLSANNASVIVLSMIGNMLIHSTAPTVSSGFGTSPSIAVNNGTAAFTINVGTGGAATSGVVGLPTATTGWNCWVNDLTAAAAHVAYNTRQTASTTTSATLENQTTSTGAAIAWAASDILRVSCFAY